MRPVGEDRVGRQVPARLLGPVVEEELPEAGALDPLEELLGHDLVGVHVGAVEDRDRPRMVDDGSIGSAPGPGCRRSGPRWRRRRPSGARRGGCGRRGPGGPRSCGSRSRRSARPARGCPGSCPGTSSSPARRQSKPAARKTSSRPSASACARPARSPARPSRRRRPATLRPLDDLGGGAEVADPRVRARADEHPVERGCPRSASRARGPCSAGRARLARRSKSSGSGTRPVTGDDHPGRGAPGDLRARARRRRPRSRGRTRRRVGAQRAPVLDGRFESLRGRAGRPSTHAKVVVVGRDHARAAAALDRHVADRSCGPPSRAPRSPGRRTRPRGRRRRRRPSGRSCRGSGPWR